MSEYTHKDERGLKALLDQSTDFEERRKIRAALRDLRNKRFKTVNVYDTPSIDSDMLFTFKTDNTSGTKQQEVHNKQSMPETHRPPEEAIFHAPVTERVHVVRKSQSFKTDREIQGLSAAGADNGISSRSAARSFLSTHLAVLAVNGSDSASSSGVDVGGVSSNKPVGRSQSFKILASKFEHNSSNASPERSSSPGLSSSHNGSFRSLQGGPGGKLQSASTVVETDQVNQVVKVGRTHSLKLPSKRDFNHHSDTPPVGSLAHSYTNEKALKLLSGSDTNIHRLGHAGGSTSMVSKDVLLTNRPIRPFARHNGVTLVNAVDHSNGNHDSTEDTTADNTLQTSSGKNHSSSFSSSSLPVLHASVEKLRQNAGGVQRSGSLHSASPSPLLTDSEMSKVKRTGSGRNAISKSGERSVWRNSSPANIQEYMKSQQQNFSVPESQGGLNNSSVTEQSSLNLSRSSTEFTTNESPLNTSGEERLAKKALEKNSKGINKYDSIQDEDQLSQMLKDAVDLDERINIRAALHKLRQTSVGDRGAQQSPTRRTSEDMSPPSKGQQPPGFKTKLEQNKAALQSLMQLNGNQSLATTNTSCDLDTTSNSSFLSTQPSNMEEEVFNNSFDNSTKSSDTPPTDYFSIENENELQNLLNQTADYFERKKIRSALTTLKRRKSLAEIDRLKERSKSSKTESVRSTPNNLVSKRHSFHGGNLIKENVFHLTTDLDTGQQPGPRKKVDQTDSKETTTTTLYTENAVITGRQKKNMGVNQNKHLLVNNNHVEVNAKSCSTSEVFVSTGGNDNTRKVGKGLSQQQQEDTRPRDHIEEGIAEPGGELLDDELRVSTDRTGNNTNRTTNKNTSYKENNNARGTATNVTATRNSNKTSLARSNAVRGKRLKSYTADTKKGSQRKENCDKGDNDDDGDDVLKKEGKGFREETKTLKTAATLEKGDLKGSMENDDHQMDEVVSEISEVSPDVDDGSSTRPSFGGSDQVKSLDEIDQTYAVSGVTVEVVSLGNNMDKENVSLLLPEEKHEELGVAVVSKNNSKQGELQLDNNNTAYASQNTALPLKDASKNSYISDFSGRQDGDLSGNISGSYVTDRKMNLKAETTKDAHSVHQVSSSSKDLNTKSSSEVYKDSCVGRSSSHKIPCTSGKMEVVKTTEDINSNYRLLGVQDDLLNDRLKGVGCSPLDTSQDNFSSSGIVSTHLGDDTEEVLHAAQKEYRHSSESLVRVSSMKEVVLEDSTVVNEEETGLHSEKDPGKQAVQADETSKEGSLKLNINAMENVPKQEEPVTQEVKTLDELRDELEQFENELQDSSDFDRRRKLRSEIRKVRILIRDGDFILRTPRYIDPVQSAATTATTFTPVSIDISEQDNSTNTSSTGNTEQLTKALVNSKTNSPPSSKDSVDFNTTCTSNTKDNLVNVKVTDPETRDSVGVLVTDEDRNGGQKEQAVVVGDSVDNIGESVSSMGNVDGKEEDEGEGYVVVEIVDGQVVTDVVEDDLQKEVIKVTRAGSLEKRNNSHNNHVDVVKNGGHNRGSGNNELTKVKDDVVHTKTLSSQNNAVVVIETVEGSNSGKDGTRMEDGVPEVTSPLADLIATDGESCNLSCHVTAPGDAIVTWYRENMVIKDTPEFKQTRDGSLLNMIIREVFPDDEGAYRCVIKSNMGEAETSCYLLVKVSGKRLRWRSRLPKSSTPRRKRRSRKNKMAVLPAFVTSLLDTTALGGDSVTLKCEVTGKPLPHIYWYYREMMLKNHPDVKQDFIAGWATLTIPQVIIDDSGPYSCVAKNAAGEVKCMCHLTVTDPSSAAIIEEAPAITMTTNDLDLSEGDCMTLVCQVTGLPNPSIAWKKDDDSLQSSQNCCMDFVYGQASLVIYKVVPRDAGMYICVAKNSAGEAGVSVMVTVRAKPKPSKLPTPQVSSNQHLGVSSNRLSSSQTNLSTKNAQSSERYLNSKNDKLTKSVSRERLSSGSSRDRLHSLSKDNNNLKKKYAGSRDRLHSASTENLKSSSSRERLNSGSAKERRKFGSKERLQSASSEKIEVTGSRSKLILEKSQPDPTTTTATTTKNWVKSEVPRRASSLLLKTENNKVVDPPRIIKGLSEFCDVMLEQYMCLECRFNFLSQNTEVRWVKDGIQLPRVGRIKWSLEKGSTKLWINSVSKGDMGIYLVVISNQGGEVRDQTEVRLKGTTTTTPTLRSKLQPKQVNEKASSLLHNVLGHMMTQQPNEGDQSKKNHSRQLIGYVTSHREQNHNLPTTSQESSKQFHTYLGSSERLQTEPEVRKTETAVTQQTKTTMSSINVQDIEDEEELHKMLNNTDNFDERKKIRSRLREIREQKSAEYEKHRVERERGREDAVQMKVRLAQEAKDRKMREFQEMARQPKKESSLTQDSLKKKHADAEASRAKKLEDMKEMARVNAAAYNIDSDTITLQRRAEAAADFKEDAVTRSTRTQNVPGGTTTTQITTTTHSTKDGSTVTTKQSKQITQTGGIGGTNYVVSKTSAENAAKRLSNTFSNKALEGTSGLITVKTEGWSSKDGITRRNEKTKRWGGSTANSKAATKTSAMDRFKQMDNTNNPESSRPNGGGRVAIQRSPSAIKQLLLEWVKKCVDGYEHVNVTNFSTSWNDGMAFCALIHHFHPEAFDYSRLDPKKRKGNFTLAFKAAEKCADIAPLLDVEDMVRMKNPDWKCVFTYVQSFYQKLRNHEGNKDKAQS